MVCSNWARPQYLVPDLSPYPQLFETHVKFFTPDYLRALIRFMGMPQIPKPPTRIFELSLMSFVAYLGQEYILENRYILLDMYLESIFGLYNFVDTDNII